METLYIVKRPFKTVGKVFLLGSVITDPTEIRLFKSKVKEGKIIEVKETDLPRIAEYVESRTGVNPTELFQSYIEAKRLADEEAKRLADEEAKRLADEEANKLAEEVKRLADEEAKKLTTKVAAQTKVVAVKR